MLGLTGIRRLLCGMAAAAASCTLGLAGPASASASSFDVNSTSDAPLSAAVTCGGGGATCTLRAAVQAADAAGGASTINLPAGNYTLTLAPPAGGAGSAADDPASGDLDVDSGASIAVVGGGSGTTVIDANAVDRAFTVHTGASLSLSDLTVERGSPAVQSAGNQQGGAIYAAGTLSTTNVDFTANGSDDGGAIYADTGSRLLVNGGTFTGNGTQYGGAVEDASINPAEIENATFTRQTAFEAGGDLYYSGSGSLTVADSTLNDSAGVDGGGAIFAAGTGDVTVTGSQFTGDSSYFGGAIYSSDPITLSEDSFTNDTASYTGLNAGAGGALVLGGSPSTLQTLSQDEFIGDSASTSGGAIYTTGGALGMAQSSITGSESEYGAALYLGGGSALFEDDTIAQNSAVKGGAFYLSTPAPFSLVNDTIVGNTVSASGGGAGIYGAASAAAGSGEGIVNTIIADNVGGDCDTTLSASVVTGYDLDSDSSCFGGLAAPRLQPGVQPLLAAPSDNGGQVLTMLEQPGSPTIGTGDTGYCPAADARSVARNPSSCDLGAYQTIGAGITASDTAPASAYLQGPFVIRLSATNTGPGIASNLTITDQLPAGAAVADAHPSAGSCSLAGTPTKVTCDLGNVAAGSSANVTLVLSSGTAGDFTNLASAADDQGAIQTATASTVIVAREARPTISRAAIRQITHTAATLRARLDPHANLVSYFFEYGTTRQFGKISRLSITSRAGVRSARVIGLLPGERYYFRLVASSGVRVAYGNTYSFLTERYRHHKPTKSAKRTRPNPGQTK